MEVEPLPARMTLAAWWRGFKNALIGTVGVVAVIGVLTFGISSIFQQSILNSLAMAFSIIWIVIIPVFVLSWLHDKNNSGSVLLDCGPHPLRSVFLIYAALFLLLAAGATVALLYNNFDLYAIAAALFSLTAPVYWMIMASGRLQIRENGLWMYWGLLKWPKIKSHQWEGETAITLMLQTKTRLSFLGKGALPVPTEHKDAIDELIKKYRAVDA